MNVHEPTAATAATTAISRTQTEEANISSTSTSAGSNDFDDDYEGLGQSIRNDDLQDLIVVLEKAIDEKEESVPGPKPSSPEKQQTHGTPSKQGSSFLSNPLSTTTSNSSFFKSAPTPSSTKNAATSSTTGLLNSPSNSVRVLDSHNQIPSHQRKQILNSDSPHKTSATDQRSKTFANSKVATSSIEDKNDKDSVPSVATTIRQSSSSHPSRTRCSDGERGGELKMKIMRDVKPGKREHKIVSPDLNKLPKVAQNSTCLSNKSITTNTADTRDPAPVCAEISQAKTTSELIFKDNMPISRENKISIDNPKVTVIEKNGCQTSTAGDNNFLASRKNNLELVSSISSTKECGTSTSIGTITDPDCLGPCEPGTSVTLEGIVWQETEGGILVVNVTWRGKTYVGTLLDCTKHDWAPPRLCESPASDIDSKTNKSVRTKRIATRSVGMGLEERALVQTTGKLRNGKGRRIPNPSDGGANNKRQRKSAKPSDADFMNESSNQDQETATKGVATNDDNGIDMDAICDDKAQTIINTDSTSDSIVLNGLDNNDEKSKESTNTNANLVVIDESSSANDSRKISHLSASESTNFNNGHNENQNCASSEESCPTSPKLISCSGSSCYKKFRDSNALLFHQSHAHGESVGTLTETTSDDSLTTPHATLVQANESIDHDLTTDTRESHQKPLDSSSKQIKQDSPAAYSDISDVEDTDRATNKNIQQEDKPCPKLIADESQDEGKNPWDKTSNNSMPRTIPSVDPEDPYVYDDAPTPPSMNPYNNSRSMIPNNGRSIYQSTNQSIKDNYPKDSKSQQPKQPRHGTSIPATKNFHNDMHDNFSRRNDQNFIPSTQHNVHVHDNHNPPSLPHSTSSHSSRRGSSSTAVESNHLHSKQHGGSHTLKADPSPATLPPTQEEGMKPSGTSTGPPPAPHSNNYFHAYYDTLPQPFRYGPMLGNYSPGLPNTSPSLRSRFPCGSPPAYAPIAIGSHMGLSMPSNLPLYPPQISPLSPVHSSRHLRLPSSGPSIPGPSQATVGQTGMPLQLHQNLFQNPYGSGSK